MIKLAKTTALNLGRGSGAASGLKRSGIRRLGHTGHTGLTDRPPLVDSPPVTDNAWDVDCSSFFPPKVSGLDIHSAYFVTNGTIVLMRQILRGFDRGALDAPRRQHGQRLAEVIPSKTNKK